jgi:hypothetical protein
MPIRSTKAQQFLTAQPASYTMPSAILGSNRQAKRPAKDGDTGCSCPEGNCTC